MNQDVSTDSHGTQVASKAVVHLCGVAKEATLVSVQIVSGEPGTVIEGLKVAWQDIQAKNRAANSIVVIACATSARYTFASAMRTREG